MKNSSKLNLLLAFSSLVLMISIASCCCCDDDDTCPDLIVQEIDLNSLDVDCPGGGGTCVTTASFTVANIGTADAGAFNIQIVLDPDASVVLDEFVGGGLTAGNSILITVMSPPGGNCFDPDCTVRVIVDNNDLVSECNENNNEGSETTIG